MALDPALCFQALASRDARFDGRFFAAVKTTGIYCRPVCPARKPLRRNVDFYPSAAAAELAGFRACRRCRPDAAPASPEWRGQSAVLCRALRLIHAGALNEGRVEQLARRVGVSARQLDRIFRAQLGAAPKAVGQSARAHLARRLLDETQLSMTEVAARAGFQSLRRFNASLLERFGAPPRELRRANKPLAPRGSGGELELRLSYRPPFDWRHLLAFLAARAIPGLERVGGGSYERALLWEGHEGSLALAPIAGRNALGLRLRLAAPKSLPGLVERVRDLCDLGADPLAIEQSLARDESLARALRAFPGTRVPGAFDGYELAVRAVLGQQVSVKGARTLLGRVVAACGPVVATGRPGLERAFPTPEAVLAADWSSLGVPRARTHALLELSRAVAQGELDLSPAADPPLVRARLCALPGIGPWTAAYISMRALRDPDAFPAGDLGLRKAAGGASQSELEARSAAWRPWRAYAAMLLWRQLS